MSIFRPGQKYSRGRRWARILVWSVFAVVVALRIVFPPEPVERFGRGPRGFDDRRYRRPPTRVEPPVAQVPADLRRLHIEISASDVRELRGYYWRGWGGGQTQERPEVQATVREGKTVYTNVALHLKGAAGSFRPFDDKPALTLSFAKHAPKQRFHGHSKISLNNSVQDPSYLSEAISRELFDAAGVPVPRADHVTVLINGRDLGLYVMLEGYGKPFLRRYFKDVSGNLYDGGFVTDIAGRLNTNSGDQPDDRSDLRRLMDAAMEPDSEKRWERLSQVLDMDRFLSFIAMEIMTCHWDGYGMNRNNYRLFHDRETDRMVFMPHGLDQMFGVSRSSPTSSIQPALQGIVARAVTTTPQGRRQLLDRIATLQTNLFIEEKLTRRVRELSRRIRPTLAAYAPVLADEHDLHAAYLCDRIGQRVQSISAQLASPREPISFDENGVARLSGWRIHTAAQTLVPLRYEKSERDGKKLLLIKAGQSGGIGSWRTRVLLEAGRYRLEGKVLTRGVGSNEGVCLRVSGILVERLTVSEEDWSTVRFNFAGREPLAEVELICELRAVGGEAWFDEESLRLVRE